MPSVPATASAIRLLLEPLGTEERARNEKRYLKSELEFLGVKVPLVRKEAKAWLKQRGVIEKEELLRLGDELWNCGVHELRSFASELWIFELRLLDAGDLLWVERWLREAGTWAHVDNLSVHLVGRLLEREPGITRTLDRWAKDSDFWIRRAALLSLLRGLRAGKGDWDSFVRYADPMLGESEFFIRKAIGWVLRETSKKKPQLVIDYVQERRAELSGLTFREAIRRLPEETQQELRSGD